MEWQSNAHRETAKIVVNPLYPVSKTPVPANLRILILFKQVQGISAHHWWSMSFRLISKKS